MLECLIDQVLNRCYRLLLRQLHPGSRNYFRLRQQRIFNAAAERILHQQLLQLQIVLRQDQVLLIGRNRALRTHHLNRRRSAHLCLPLGIIQRLLTISQCLLLHAHVFIGIHQIPIHIFDLVDRSNNLQAEGHVGNLAVVLGDVNEAQVRSRPKSLQQVLRDLELKIRSQVRRQQTYRTVGGDVRVVESHR